MVAPKFSLEKLSEEANQIVNLINEKKHFLLSGGAGSGKTYSLVEVLHAVTDKYPSFNIGCITYTNAAVDEIEDRISYDSIHVSTIHDFLWANIRNFQSELKETLVEMINDPTQSKIKIPNVESVEADFFDDIESIQYKEYLRLAKGIISHDEVILLASQMYEKYEKLCSITKDKFPFIFVDEYQDTNPLVVKILLEDMEKSPKENVVGFFGDAMQSIYDGSVGNLDTYIDTEPKRVVEVQKLQNRRNPGKIINLANKIRTDGLTQQPSDDASAPNMDENGVVKSGDIKFIYSANLNIDPVREYLGWEFEDNTLVKELNLTHNLIADKANFPELMRIYDKDKILEFLRNKVRRHLKENDPELDTSEKTLSQVLEHVGAAVKPTKGQQEYIDNYPEIHAYALSLPYDLISKLYVDKDQLLDDKKNFAEDEGKPGSNRDDLIKHLFKIETCIRLYQSNQFNQFIKLTDFSISSIADKIRLRDAIQSFTIDNNSTIRQVIDMADDLGIVIKDDRLNKFIEKRIYLYKQVCDISYQEFRNVYDYLEGYSPFSTQHKTKGTEFPNVLVVLDNGRWNQYNFKYLFEGNGTDSVRQRSEKIFYVCCTRAMEKLAVFFPNPTALVLGTAATWFGKENIVNLDEL
ncbi:UvrD-helicase domain-containing protein [Desulfotignum phosphitoxidans]|uniref:UvrD/REP ATP-dependent DNA helicase n=1 Tax=Desulfotignum phosphitoxidans DSM 13687 TaxID=1286635 RepID=S0FYY6_9BACT|nr:UvrD-helicase domain-containing protein [Desulfotignum phosphitoxidans]EMS78424.1 uvrD/REP ATP-dependent DNA helicase [Desulfotignum phosphitoxidans DSM 13687]